MMHDTELFVVNSSFGMIWSVIQTVVNNVKRKTWMVFVIANPKANSFYSYLEHILER